MERGFYNDEFEQLIKQKADQYKMYPSEQVWKGIHRSLHTRRKWYWLSFLLFLSGISYYAIVQLIAPSSGTRKPVANINPATTTAATNGTPAVKPAIVIPFSTQVKQQSTHGSTATTLRSFVTNPNKSNSPEATGGIVATLVTITNIDTGTETAANDNTTTDQTQHNRQTNRVLADRFITIPSNNKLIQQAFENSLVILFEDITPAAPADLDQKPALPEKAVLVDAGAEEDKNRINWLQQYAVYELAIPKMKRISWQLAFAPTMNYRKLSGSNTSIASDIKNVPMSLDVAGDPNKLVNHKPALGFELGSHFLYAVNKGVQVKAGAQFTYSRYAIQAYGSYATDLATIALNGSAAGMNADSITNYTRIRNFGGDVSQNLQNQYFQLSIPIGLEIRLLGNDRLQIGAAGTVQPTYLINKNSYLITTDYKNYTKEPSLVRRWNVNTGAEIFLAYKSGDLKWQVGPQLRYQLFSSYVNEYPIREYLMEYGIKIGVTKTIR
jgi:hypothetical protein